MANCTTYLYDDSRLGCALPIDHDGPHVTRDGHGWHDSDDMDGGVAAALIEKEAEQDEGAHIGPEGEVDWHGLYLSENRRAEQAEKERDGALRLAKTAADQVDEALGMVARGECHDCILDAAVIREPLTPDAITDEMVERARNALSFDGRLSPSPRLVREMLTAALTEPPARPEGLTRLIDTIREATYDPEPVATGEALYNAGVRVVTEEQP